MHPVDVARGRAGQSSRSRSPSRATLPPTSVVPPRAGRQRMTEPRPWWTAGGRPSRAQRARAAEPVASSSAMPAPGTKARARTVPAASSIQAQAQAVSPLPGGSLSAFTPAGESSRMYANGGAHRAGAVAKAAPGSVRTPTSPAAVLNTPAPIPSRASSQAVPTPGGGGEGGAAGGGGGGGGG